MKTRSAKLRFLAAVVVTIALAIVDWRTADLQFAALALVPFMVIAWSLSLRTAVLVGALYAAGFTYLDYRIGFFQHVNLTFDAVATSAAFIATAIVLDSLRRSRQYTYRLEEQLHRQGLDHDEHPLIKGSDTLYDLAHNLALKRLLEEGFQRATARGRKFALLLVEVASFKSYVELNRDDVGDRLLQRLEKRLQGLATGPNAVMQLTRNEFAVLLEGGGESDVRMMAALATLAASLDIPFSLDGQIVHLETAHGIAVFPDDAGNVGDLLYLAAKRMYDERLRRYR